MARQALLIADSSRHLPNTCDYTVEKGESWKDAATKIEANFVEVYAADTSATASIALKQPILATDGIGAPAGTGVTAAEYGNAAVHKTVLTLAATSITMTDAGAAGSHGTQKVYDFPEGVIQFLGASYNLTTLAGAGGIADGAALVGALGTGAVATDNATLAGAGEADLIASTVGTLTAGAGTLTKHASLVATAFDGHTTPIDAVLNLAVPDADSSASDTVAVSGTITLLWANLGDYT